MCGAKISCQKNEVYAGITTHLLRQTEDCLIQRSGITVPTNVKSFA